MVLDKTQHQSKPLSIHQPCPHCGSSDALAEYDDGHTFCFSCQRHTPPPQRRVDDGQVFTYQFLPLRGVTADTFRTYEVRTKIDVEGKPVSIGFRYPNGDYKVRLLNKKIFYWTTTKSVVTDKKGLFGQDRFAAGSHKYCVITEGEIDACSLYQVLHLPVVSVHSASSAVSDVAHSRSWLQSFERIYLAFDSDAPGREATQRVAKLFDYDKIWDVKFSNRKDANDYLQHGEDTELRNIFWNSRRYLPECIISSPSEFRSILQDEPRKGVEYPFAGVTEKTNGIRLGESVLITAQEGIGKTELMHAIEYSLLANTDSNVGAIFLEELPRRHLQALAGIHLKAAVHLPDSGYTVDQVRDAVRDLTGENERLFIYRNFGSDDPEVLLDTIRFLVAGCNCSYILLDHISMVVSGNTQEDERRKLDWFSTKLEMMVKELCFGLILVSHVNDLGQTRGSRYISKIADIRIDMGRDISDRDDKTRRTIHLNITKNRPAWQTGWAGSYLFDPLTNSYEEIKDGYPDSQTSVPGIASPNLTASEIMGRYESKVA